jgi:hypothetical protein
VNEELFATCPPTVTENDPDMEFAGTIAMILLSDQLATVALTPFSETVLGP